MANIRAAAFVAIIAYGLVLLLAMGEIDLSVGGTLFTPASFPSFAATKNETPNRGCTG